MDTNVNYTIRNMTQVEVENIAVKWAANEGWNPGLHEAQCFYSTDPKGFFAGFLGNEPISCISVVSYDKHFAFLGFYIVKPEYRGKGYGLKLWDKALTYLKTQNIGLDGVIEQQENYKKSGFKLAYSNIRYEGIVKHSNEHFSELVDLSKVSFNEIVQYDNNFFPVSRPRFLKCWVKQPESLSLAALHGGKIVGYSVIRRCITGYKIGPLFADTKDLANILFTASSNFAQPGSLIYLDTPEINQSAIQLAKELNMKKIFGTVRMYTKFKPNIDINRVFGVTTFELG